MTDSGFVTCKEVEQLKSGINVKGIVERKERIRVVETKFGETKVCDASLRDKTGSIRLTLWDLDTLTVENEDIISIEGGKTSIFNNQIQLHKDWAGNIKVISKFQESFGNNPNLEYFRLKKSILSEPTPPVEPIPPVEPTPPVEPCKVCGSKDGKCKKDCKCEECLAKKFRLRDKTKDTIAISDYYDNDVVKEIERQILDSKQQASFY